MMEQAPLVVDPGTVPHRLAVNFVVFFIFYGKMTSKSTCQTGIICWSLKTSGSRFVSTKLYTTFLTKPKTQILLMKNIKKIVRDKLNSIGSSREDLLSFFEQECLRIRSEYNTTEKDPYDDSGSHPSCSFFTHWDFYDDIEETGEIWNDDDTDYKIDLKKRNMKPEEAKK